MRKCVGVNSSLGKHQRVRSMLLYQPHQTNHQPAICLSLNLLHTHLKTLITTFSFQQTFRESSEVYWYQLQVALHHLLISLILLVQVLLQCFLLWLFLRISAVHLLVPASSFVLLTASFLLILASSSGANSLYPRIYSLHQQAFSQPLACLIFSSCFCFWLEDRLYRLLYPWTQWWCTSYYPYRYQCLRLEVQDWSQTSSQPK